MKKVYQLAVVAAIVFLLTGVAFAGNRVIVTYAPGTTQVAMRNIALQNGATVIKDLSIINGVVLTLPAQAADKARAAILAHASVVSIEDDAIVTAFAPPPGKKPVKLRAKFVAEPTSGSAPLTVQFTDQSQGEIVSWQWDFDNDGTIDSTAQHPTHVYAEVGMYTVSLMVTASNNKTDTETKTDYISVTTAGPPVADFAAEPTSGYIPLPVQFTDLSTGSVNSWEWDFDNDGSVDSTLQNPTHTYETADTYTVTLTVSGLHGSDTKIGYITAVEPPEPDPEVPWGVDRIDAELAWGVSTGAGVNVAVLDTGIDLAHPDLWGNVAGDVTFVDNTTSGSDDNGHGTHCAGTIAAVDNDLGVVGVAPGASLYAVKVLNSEGWGYYSWIISGIDWCIDNRIDVISMSLGGSTPSKSLQNALKRAYRAGVVTVAAAGNDSGRVSYPAKYAETIAVSATDSYDNLAWFSNYGREIDLAAPGMEIYSTMPTYEVYLNTEYGCSLNYESLNGTSMACPHVSGTVALMKANEVWSYDRLWNTADDIGLTSNQQGNGLVDAEEAATGVQTNP